ncbi:MAG TPA: lamin tail domain-containing protein [Candidatus Limnocylindrales bacterium]
MRAALVAVSVAVAGVAVEALPASGPQIADAAGCVRVVGGQFDPDGNENYMPTLNQEYVKIRNVCSRRKDLTGWRVNDYGKIHVYRFRSGFHIGAGVTIKLRSGVGTDTAANLYWGRTYGAIWNNTGTERVYLRNASGTTVSTWTV